MTRPEFFCRRSLFRAGVALPLAICVAACGSNGGDPGPVVPGPATASTLAYVLTECSAGAHGGSIRQALQVRRKDAAPMIVVEHSTAGPGLGFQACTTAALIRNSPSLLSLGVFHRLGVSPDGSRVVFEVTDAKASTLFPANRFPEEETGFFSVRSDGSDLRRLGPASRISPAALGYTLPFLAFSPDGREVAYVDLGPGRDGEESPQIFVLDLARGTSVQVTRLPRAAASNEEAVCCPLFNDDSTISFFTRSDPDGMHGNDERINVTVRADGTGLTVSPPLKALPDSELVATFLITGSASVALISLPGPAVNDGGRVREVIAIDRDDHILQLSDFQRSDTYTPTLSADGERVFFSGAADPLGRNPTKNCQIFSVDRLGGDLRQLTDFSEATTSSLGCTSLAPPLGCFAFYMSRDSLTDDLIFLSSCDPFGTNPFGAQVFAMHQDGSGLHQITDVRGYFVSDATTTNEYAHPFAYPGQHDYFR